MAAIKRGVYVTPDTYKTKEITSTKDLRSGSVVLEPDGFVGVVCEIYTDTEVSLCLSKYATKGDMVERDFMTDISTLKLIKF